MSEQASAQFQVTCQCGWRTRGTKEVVVQTVQEHGREAHNMDLSEEQVMAQAVPAEGA